MIVAEFSQCRQYRYTLWRSVSDRVQLSYVNFICLNPSTADETKDDNTIRKCKKFAKTWGFDAMCVTNLFAWRDTSPNQMKLQPEPIGPENDFWLTRIARDADLVVAAWSQHGGFLGRSKDVLTLLPDRPKILRMGTGKNPEPWHPLYLPDSTEPMEWPV